MTTASRITILILTLVLGRLPVEASPPIPVVDTISMASVDPFTAAETELIEFAYSRFALAGLDLPDVEIEFRADTVECYGYGGVYLPGELIVRICRPSERTMVHELAHAWLENTLTATDREAFLAFRGLDTWTEGTQWDQRGAEQAAEIITWGLAEDNMLIRWLDTNPDDTVRETWRLFKIPESDPDRLASAYEQLTGDAPELRILDDPRGIERATESTLSPEALRVR